MGTSRSERIVKIIEKRSPLATKIKSIEASLEDLAAKLGYLEEHRQHLLGRLKDRSDIEQPLKGINFSDCKNDIAKQLQTLKKLRGRFERKTLNIGVVGLMGQGKSTLLQSLSGLTNDEIPARKGRACTAVRSVLYHHNGETEAKVILHSEQSLIEEVIHEYWRELEWEKQGFQLPLALNDFARKPLPEPPAGATNGERYKHLKDYHSNLNGYRSLLQLDSQQEGLPISKEEIPEYVTQWRDGQDRLTSFKHLAVKEVRIYCRFKNAEVGKIALVDVPGLGDTKLGDEALILKTLGQEVDVVLFVRRPDPKRYQWLKDDGDLYDKAAKELNQLAERSFMVLNHQADTNDHYEACEDLKRSIPFKVVECVIVDCSNSEVANKQVLDRVLEHLTNRVVYLDENLASSCLEGLASIQDTVNAELDKARQVFNDTSLDEAWADRCGDLFDILWGQLNKALKERLKKIQAQRHEPDQAFEKQIKDTLHNCRKDTGIASLEEIQLLMDCSDGPQSAYETCLNEVRLHLSQKFISLDRGLKESLDQVKHDLAEVLAKEGRLSGLSEAKGAEFFKAIALEIPSDLKKLKEVFQNFANFDLLYRGMIQHRIRPLLDSLTPGDPKCPQPSKSPSAQEFLEILQELQKEAVYNCELALEEWH